MHAFALAVQPAIAFRGAFFRCAALVGDLGHAFLFDGCSGVGLAAFGLRGFCRAGSGQKAEAQANGQQCGKSARSGCLVGGEGKGRHRDLMGWGGVAGWV